MADGGDAPDTRTVAEQLFANPNDPAALALGHLIEEVAGPGSPNQDYERACPPALLGDAPWTVVIKRALPGTTDRTVQARLNNVPWANGLQFKGYYASGTHAHVCTVSNLKQGLTIFMSYSGGGATDLDIEHIWSISSGMGDDDALHTRKCTGGKTADYIISKIQNAAANYPFATTEGKVNQIVFAVMETLTNEDAPKYNGRDEVLCYSAFARSLQGKLIQVNNRTYQLQVKMDMNSLVTSFADLMAKSVRARKVSAGADVAMVAGAFGDLCI